MQRKRIARGHMLWERRVSRDQLRGGHQVKSSWCQHRRVQRLANVAGSFRAIGMLVKEAAARREVQQQGASKYWNRALRHSG